MDAGRGHAKWYNRCARKTGDLSECVGNIVSRSAEVPGKDTQKRQVELTEELAEGGREVGYLGRECRGTGSVVLEVGASGNG